MCSWCYGFAPQITRLLDNNKKDLDFKLVMGGLRPYGRETMHEIREFLVHHWEQVQEKSGQPFSYGIIDKNEFIYDTEPPSRAVVVVRMIKPEALFDFFKDVQKAFYYGNKDTNDINTYTDLLTAYGIDEKQFKDLFKSDKLKQMVRSDFEFSASLGVRGFPTVALYSNEKYYLVTHGYTTSDEMEGRVNLILNEKADKA